MSPEPAPAPHEFSIATPGDWMVVDFDVLGDQAVIGGLVDQRVEEEPALEPHRDELAELVLRSARIAEAAGVMFCATLATTRDDGAPILATLSVAAGEKDTSIDPNADAMPASADESPEIVVNRIEESDGSTRYAPVAIELPSGVAARMEHLGDVPLFGSASLVCLTVQYVLEVPHAVDQFLALTFTTPSLAYRARLTDLFDDIARTFAWGAAPAPA